MVPGFLIGRVSAAEKDKRGTRASDPGSPNWRRRIQELNGGMMESVVNRNTAYRSELNTGHTLFSFET